MREVKVPPKKAEYGETPTGIKPHDSFVDVSDEIRGLAVITRGTPEHEVMDVRGRPIAITLIRAVGWLSRADGPYRNGERGPAGRDTGGAGTRDIHFQLLDIPSREGLGRSAGLPACHRGEYSAGDDAHEQGSVMIFGRSFPTGENDAGIEGSLFRVEPECFVVTAVKNAEDGDGIVIRACNLGTAKRKGGRYPE